MGVFFNLSLKVMLMFNPTLINKSLLLFLSITFTINFKLPLSRYVSLAKYI